MISTQQASSHVAYLNHNLLGLTGEQLYYVVSNWPVHKAGVHLNKPVNLVVSGAPGGSVQCTPISSRRYV